MKNMPVMVPMRDGVRLYTDIYLPEGEGPWPVILSRTLYSFVQMTPMAMHDRKTQNGYVSILQNCRGFYRSEGEFDDPTCERDDAYDTIEWIIRQPWCDGNVGMSGMSYNGYTQFAAASGHHPNLKTIAPEYAATVFSGLGFHDRGIGAMSELFWGADRTQKELVFNGSHDDLKHCVATGLEKMATQRAVLASEASPDSEEKKELQRKADESALKNTEAIRKALTVPLYDLVDQAIDLCPWTEKWFRQVDNPDFFHDSDFKLPENTPKIPVLQITGWYDHFIKDAFKLFNANRKNGVCHKLIVTPNTHMITYGPNLPPIGEKAVDYEFVNDSITTSKLPKSVGENCFKNWMDHWLKGVPSNLEQQAPITLYVQGKNEFRDEYEWPLARTEWAPMYLHSHGNARDSLRDGKLSFEKEDASGAEYDCYDYDPAHPTPTLGGQFAPMVAVDPGIFEQSSVEAREDVLVYTSDPLKQELEITGPMKLVLYASTSAVDTDFTATLTVVEPDDTSWNVSFGICRLRHREGHKGLVTPDSIQEVEIELTPTSYLLAKGQRLRIQISSSNYPSIDPNPNTGKSLWNDRTNEMVIAHQRVYHSDLYPSHLILPVIPTKE